LKRLGWNPADLARQRKGDPAKLTIASRLRQETVLPMTVIAAKLHLGSPKSARARLREQRQKNTRYHQHVNAGSRSRKYRDALV